MSITELDRSVGAGSVSVESRLRAACDEMASIVAGLDVSSLGGPDASRVALLFARTERLSNAGKTLAAGRVAEVGHYRAEGFDKPSGWLAARTKTSSWEAARTLDAARDLADPALAPTRDAFVTGRLTGAQTTEIASAAAKAPHQQDRLLATARRETVTQLRNECRQIRLARKQPEKPKERRDRIVGEMAFGTRTLGDDLSELNVRMPTSWLALIVAAIGEQCDAVYARAKAEGRTDPHQVYMVEALVTLLLFGTISDTSTERGHTSDANAEDADDNAAPACEGASEPTEEATGDDVADDTTGGHRDAVDGVPALVHDDDDDVGGGCGDGDLDDLDVLYDQLLAALDGEARPARPRRGGRKRRGRCRCGGRVTPKTKIIARVDQSALLRGYATDGELCEIAGIGPVSVTTVRELWPDAVVKLVLTDGIQVRNVVHLGRKATEAMETALQFENPLCSNIACDHQRFVQIDHRLGYANVHRTTLDELDALCTHCHALKTNYNWQLVRGHGRRAFVPPEHADHPGDPPTPRRPARPAAAPQLP